MSFLFCDWLSVSVNSTVSLKPLAFSTSLYNGVAFSNSSLDESLDTLRLKLLCNCHFLNRLSRQFKKEFLFDWNDLSGWCITFVLSDK